MLLYTLIESTSLIFMNIQKKMYLILTPNCLNYSFIFLGKELQLVILSFKMTDFSQAEETIHTYTFLIQDFVLEIPIQKFLGEEIAYISLQVLLNHQGKPKQEFKAGSSKQDLSWKTWRNDAYYNAPYSLLNLFSYIQDHMPLYTTMGSTTHSELGPTTFITNQKFPNKHVLWPIQPTFCLVETN